MKNMKAFLFILCFCLTTLGYAANAQAAQASGSLQAGRVYEFANKDTRTIAYVSFTGSARYEYVSRDQNGLVVDFGISSGRFPVRGGGSTQISLSGTSSASVTYDSSNITVREAAGAALARVSAAPGETVAVTNAFDDSLSLSIDNAGQTEYAPYDCAVYDRNGQASFFADACRYTTMAVPASGQAVFTAGAGGLTLMYPAVWDGREFSVHKETDPALYKIKLVYNQPYTLMNTNASLDYDIGITAGGSVTYDYVSEDLLGYTVDYGRAAQGEQVSVKAESLLYITPRDRSAGAKAEGVTLIFPNAWRAFLQVSAGGAGTLTSVTAAVGETLTLENRGASDFTFQAEAAVPVSVLDSVYSGGPYDETEYVTEKAFNEFTLGAGHTWMFTVKKGNPLTLWLPASWLERGLVVGGTVTPAMSGHALAAGATLRIENTNPASAYAVTLQSTQTGRALSYDYVSEEASSIQYEADASAEVLTLPPGGTITLTAGKTSPLTVRLPAAEAVTAQESAVPALLQYELAPGQTTLIQNTAGLRSYAITLKSAVNAAKPSPDYVLKDENGQITDYGRVDIGAPLTIEAGGSVRLTNTEVSTLAVIYPYTWLGEGLQAGRTNVQALWRQAFAENQIAEIVNLDKRYNRSVRVENDKNTAMNPPAAYEYTLKSNAQTVADYGTAREGLIQLHSGGRVALMPTNKGSLSICYPLEWHEQIIRISEGSAAPLRHITLKPGQRLKLENWSSTPFSIQNSSQDGQGGYYLRNAGDNRRIPLAEQAQTGFIELPADTVVNLTAATGANLEIWMPREWAEKLIR